MQWNRDVPTSALHPDVRAAGSFLVPSGALESAHEVGPAHNGESRTHQEKRFEAMLRVA